MDTLKIKEIILEEDKHVSTYILNKVIKIERQLRVETFSPYKVESDQEILRYIESTKNYFYYLLAEKQNTFVGCLKVEINMYDGNRDFLYLELNVVKEFRMKGIAKKLLKFLIHNIPYNFTTFEFHIRADLDPKLELFLLSIGSELVYTARRSATNLKKFNVAEISNKAKELQIKASQNGFSFIFIKNGSFGLDIPFSFDDFVDLVGQIKNSIPREDRENNQIVLTSEKLKEKYEKYSPHIQEYYTWIAYDSFTKKPIAFTESQYNINKPDIISQEETGVLSEYRGHKLGLTLKYKMLEYLLKSKKTKNAIYWSTSNAQSNKYMIAINNELNFYENAIFKVFYLKRQKVIDYFNE